jgi:hypothetical protein
VPVIVGDRHFEPDDVDNLDADGEELSHSIVPRSSV